MRELLAAIGMAWLIGAPIAAVFLFGREEKTGWLPPENDRVPVVYPDEDHRREEVPR